MGRFEGPVRFRFNGDPELARQYMALGRKYLGEMQQQMEHGGLAQLSRTIRNQDGTFMQIYSGYGENQIEIFVDEPEPPIEPRIGGTFVTVPASEEASNGWGEPFFDDGTPINPPLGTEGGQYPQTLLSWVGDAWSTKRYWQYDDKWPTGIEYGNNSWAGKTVDGLPVVISWRSEYRYRDWGFIFNYKSIYYDGSLLCNAKEYVIGAAVVNDNLVVLSATQELVSGRLATWHFRPFRRSGYPNDDDYDLVTNPLGWQECSGDFQEVFAREDARQPLVFSPQGDKAALSYIVDRADYGPNRTFINKINLVTFSVVSSFGQVTISRITEIDTYDVTSLLWRTASTFSHKRATGPEDTIEVDIGETSHAPIASLYHEYDVEGNLKEYGLFSSSSFRDERIDRSDNSTAYFKREEQTTVRLNSITYQAYKSNADVNPPIPYVSRNVSTVFIDGNISLGYFLAVEYTLLQFPDPGTIRLLIITPAESLELFSYSGAPPLPATYAALVGAYNPAHSQYDPDFTQTVDWDTSKLNRDLGKGLGLPEPAQVDSGFEFYFAAHRNPEDQIIVTAWVRFDRGTEVLFGAYNFITDGILPGLTKVQGTNQRHKNTGVI